MRNGPAAASGSRRTSPTWKRTRRSSLSRPAAYDLIVDCYFLHRPLFAAIRGGVRPGGLFVAALHLPAPDGQRGHGYVLRPGELERMVRGWRWDVLHAAERTARVAAGGEPGVAEIVARRPDVRPPSHS